jgi:hypothetical protein
MLFSEKVDNFNMYWFANCDKIVKYAISTDKIAPEFVKLAEDARSPNQKTEAAVMLLLFLCPTIPQRKRTEAAANLPTGTTLRSP